MPCFYGLSSVLHIVSICRTVCDVLGHGKAFAATLLMAETAEQETRSGRFRDPTPKGAGRGLFQCDLIAFRDIQSRTRASDVLLIKEEFGIDIKSVTHEYLDYSPLLAAIFCRLFYKLLPSEIPADLHGRADYWKKYYNTAAGDGTAAEYVARCIDARLSATYASVA